MNDKELLESWSSLDTSTQKVVKLESPEAKTENYYKTHCGVISSSNVHKLCTYQPDPFEIEQLRVEIGELEYKIATSTRGTKTAEKERDGKMKRLDAMVNDKLSDAAIEWCVDLAMERITGFNPERHVDRKSLATEWGNQYEPLAVERIKALLPESDLRYTNENQKFINLPGFEFVGATPDGVFYYQDTPFKTLDIKCPYRQSNHRKNRLIETFEEFKTEYPVYYWQFTLQMMCTGVDEHLFVSFDPDMPKSHDLVTKDFFINPCDADFVLNRIKQAEDVIAGVIAEYKQ